MSRTPHRPNPVSPDARARCAAWVLAALFLGAPAAHAGDAADEGWRLVQQAAGEHGHTVYARPRAGSRYAEYRMDVVLDAGPADVMAALEHNLFDPETYTPGFGREVLRRDGSVVVTHDTIEVPFLSDRDVVMRTEFGRDPESGARQIRWNATRDEGPAPREGVLRLPSSEGSWTLLARDGGTLAVYRSHVDLGGSLPSAFVEARMPAEISRQAIELRRTMRERQLARR